MMDGVKKRLLNVGILLEVILQETFIFLLLHRKESCLALWHFGGFVAELARQPLRKVINVRKNGLFQTAQAKILSIIGFCIFLYSSGDGIGET